MDRLKSSSLSIPSSTKNNLANSSNSKFTNSTSAKFDPLSKNSGNHISFQDIIKQKSATPKNLNINKNDNLINNPNPTFQNKITENNSKINKNYSKDEERQSMKNMNNNTNGK
jgi:hypothetical protein